MYRHRVDELPPEVVKALMKRMAAEYSLYGHAVGLFAEDVRKYGGVGCEREKRGG